jgi:hypothetical protein
MRENRPVADPFLPNLHNPDAYRYGLARTVRRLYREVVAHDGVVADDGDAWSDRSMDLGTKVSDARVSINSFRFWTCLSEYPQLSPHFSY